MWWDSARIEATVTRQFVCSHLLPQEIERLGRPVGFGDGLTDGTYWEWVEEKAKRIFLILVDLGVPDQIFGIIDDSWDDQDLPIALDQVGCLALTPARDEKFERKFYYRQFHYLFKPLARGAHIDYEDFEVVPLDVIDRKPALAISHPTDRVVLPNHPDKALCRRRIPLGTGGGCLSYDEFLYQVDSIRNVQNEHLASYFASYVHQGYGYVLMTPISDVGLKSFLATTPATFKSLEKRKRRELVLNWVHCLVDTICFLHIRGLAHGNIKPSTILFTHDNHIFFSDFSRLNTELLASTSDKTSFDKESYDYAAPEQWYRPTSSQTRPISWQFSPMHRKPKLTPVSPAPTAPSPDDTTFCISRGNSDHASSSSGASVAATMRAAAAPALHLSPQAADIFSLGCVILELLSFLMKKTPRAFAAHRAAKHKSGGRGGAVLDSSFHRNLGQVESWMGALARDAAKKKGGGGGGGREADPLRGVAPMLHVVERMLALHPSERPAALEVQRRMYEILHDVCGVAEPHCVHQYGGWDFGIGALRIGSVSEARDEEDGEVMSVATGRGSSGARSLASRADSSASGAWGTGAGSIAERDPASNNSSSGASIREQQPALPLSPRLKQSEIGSGLKAIQNLRVRSNSGRQWQAPAVGVGY